MDKMVAFYCDVLGLTVNQGIRSTDTLVFLTANPETDDHEIAFIRGREGDATILNHIAFRASSPEDVKAFYDQFIESGVPIDHTVSHSYVTQGNTVSCYFLDPEGNTTEVFWRTGPNCWVPTGEPVDLSDSDETLLAHVNTIIERNKDVPVGGIREAAGTATS